MRRALRRRPLGASGVYGAVGVRGERVRVLDLGFGGIFIGRETGWVNADSFGLGNKILFKILVYGKNWKRICFLFFLTCLYFV